MTCIRCGLADGYNRAVVDVPRGAEIGGLCRDCELETFGTSLERGDWAALDGCALCKRDGFYALPRWEPTVLTDGDRLVNHVDYDVTDDTLILCDEHLHSLAADVAPDVSGGMARPTD